MVSESTQSQFSSTKLVGKEISHYQFLLKIHQTDLFTFYKAFDTSLDKKIMLQVFSSEFAYSQQFVDKLKMRAVEFQSVAHPNIATILEIAGSEKLLYIAWDFVPKIIFSKRYNQKIDPVAASTILVPIAEAMSSCHQANVIHGNLNPQCLFIDETNKITICDFGIEHLTTRYISQQIPGNWLEITKHAYLAPEQILQKKVSQQTDTYALGMIFTELISGKRAFSNTSILESLFNRIQAQMNIFPIEYNTLPKPSRKVIRKAISFFPNRRYQSGTTFLEALKSIQKGRWQKAKREIKQKKTRLSPIWIIAAVLLIAGGVLSMRFFQKKDTEVTALVNTETPIVSMAPPTEMPSPTIPPTPIITKTTKPTTLPTPTSQPRLDNLPVIFDNQLPTIREDIEADNVENIVHLARWGLGAVHQFAWSPDNQQFVLGTSIGAFSFDSSLNFIHFYDTSDWVNAVAYSPDGKMLITGTRAGLIQTWGINQDSFSPLGGHIQEINSLAFSPDGTLVASGSEDNTVKIWDVENKEVLQSLEGHLKGVKIVAFSPNGQLVASGSSDNTVKIWNVTDGQQQMNLAFPGPVSSLTFSPDGNLLAAVAGERLVKLYDIATGQPLPAVRGMASPIMGISFAPNNQQIAVGELNGSVSVWDVQSLKQIWSAKNESMPLSLEKGYNYVHDVKFSPDGTVLASALWDNKVVLFDAATGEQLNKLDEYGEFNQALAFSPDSTMLASQSLDGMTKIWNVQKGEIRHTIPGYLIQGQSFSNNNKLLALKANKSTVTVYDTNTGELKYTLSGHNNIFNITFSKNDLYLAAGSGKDFKVWSMSTGLEVITTPTVNGGCTYTHSVSGESLAIGNALHHLTFSNPRTLCTISRPSWVKSMDISGSVVIFGGTSMVKIENYPGNPGLTSIMGYDALCVDASTNTDLIMAGVSDKSIHIWELETQEEILNLPAHESPPTSVQFSPNNKLIATTSLDGTIHIWGVH